MSNKMSKSRKLITIIFLGQIISLVIDWRWKSNTWKSMEWSRFEPDITKSDCRKIRYYNSS